MNKQFAPPQPLSKQPPKNTKGESSQSGADSFPRSGLRQHRHGQSERQQRVESGRGASSQIGERSRLHPNVPIGIPDQGHLLLLKMFGAYVKAALWGPRDGESTSFEARKRRNNSLVIIIINNRLVIIIIYKHIYLFIYIYIIFTGSIDQRVDACCSSARLAKLGRS